MLYYLGIALSDTFSPLNVLRYHTVRAGGAALTGFAISLLIGPMVIEWLRMLKVGQFIRKEHVADLHALHKKKEGTPTMGGVLILMSTVISIVLWARPNTCLVLVLAVFCALGAVGFMDDYIKIRRKHNKGLSAKAKMIGQIVVGLSLGVWLTFNPVTPSRTRVTHADVLNWKELARVVMVDMPATNPDFSDFFTGPAISLTPSNEEKDRLLEGLNKLFDEGNFAAMAAKTPSIEQAGSGETSTEIPTGSNRVVFQSVFPGVLAQDIPNLHTKLEIPGLKEVFIPLGIAYALFVLIVIVGASNAVNLTDGLDGLAIGASIISIMAYTAIAYVVSRADWSRYLFLVHVPGASELTVFGAALLGTGLGFLWFNSHPAEVFMGDTGSLALGGAIGTMAILTKQELLLILVGGLFVMEAGSVILQVASFKLRGKRIFRMAPLHHHFELMGWSESKVTIRFWIIAILFALTSLGALKLR